MRQIWPHCGPGGVQRAANKRPSLDRRSGDVDARTDVDAALDGLNTVPLLSSLPQVQSVCRHPQQPQGRTVKRTAAVKGATEAQQLKAACSRATQALAVRSGCWSPVVVPQVVLSRRMNSQNGCLDAG